MLVSAWISLGGKRDYHVQNYHNSDLPFHFLSLNTKWSICR